MSGLQPDEAKDEVLDLFKAHWDAAALVIALAPTVVYDNEEAGTLTPPWARVSVLMGDGGGQRTLSEPGRRTFERLGVAVVQVFGVKAKGVTTPLRLAKIALDAFEGEKTPGGVWFRNARIVTVGPGRDAYQVNAVVEFAFDEIK